MRRTIGLYRRIAFRFWAFLAAAIVLAGGQAPPQPQSVSIKDFGAKGDGSADDSAAIETASHKVADTGGVLVCPPGTYLFNPSRHKIVVGSNMTITGGCLIRVVPETGNYMYIISARTPTTHVENVVIDGISIDENTLVNVTARVSAKDSDAKTQQIAILFFDVRNIVIRNTLILSSGVDAIDCNGPAVKNVKIEHNLITFQKRSDQPGFDNSSIYVDGTDFDVSNNVLRSGADQAATTAIEVHTGAGIVSENTIDWFASGIIGSSTRGLRVTHNTITRAAVGISLWAQNGPNADSEVSWNIVSLNNNQRLESAPGGIYLTHGNESTRSFERLTIADNIVAFEPELSRNMAGYDSWGIGLESNGAVENAKVLRNTIVNAPIRGIKVGAIGGGQVSGVSVADNTIVNAGVNAAPAISSYRAGIALDGKVNDLEISGNIITCTGSACESWGIWGADRGDDFHNIRVHGNFVQRSSDREYSLPSSVDRPVK